MTTSEAKAITGGLSNPSKMPGKAYNIPAQACKVGSRLVSVVGSVCHDCYALKGRYRFPNVRNALQRRLEALEHPQWVEAMIALINSQRSDYFRWHDSGDIQDVAHLERIVAVAVGTPRISHWLPTREYKIVAAYNKQGGEFPDNLTVRLSGHMVDGPAPELGLPTSTVSTGEFNCPASLQDNNCGDCRACWDSSVPNVSYHYH